MTFKMAQAACCIAGLVLATVCLADETDEQDLAAEQLEFMMSSVRNLQVVPEGHPEAAWRFHPKPLLRWTNPVGGAPDGIVVLWTDGVRPKLVATVFQNKGGNWVQEYYSLAACSFVVRDQTQVLWEPRKQADEFRSVDDSPTPADSAAKRLAQMRALAREFSAHDDFTSNNQSTRHELRLLTNPIYRYAAAEDGVIDGAVFAFVLGTDPELLIVLEARQSGDGSETWFYRFEAMTYWPVEVKRQARSVWSVRTAPRDDFHQRIIHRQ
jgi:hypothetical protein